MLTRACINTLLHVVHIFIKITFDAVKNNTWKNGQNIAALEKNKHVTDPYTYLRRWQNMSIISNSDFTQSSREKSSNYQNRRQID